MTDPKSITLVRLIAQLARVQAGDDPVAQYAIVHARMQQDPSVMSAIIDTAFIAANACQDPAPHRA